MVKIITYKASNTARLIQHQLKLKGFKSLRVVCKGRSSLPDIQWGRDLFLYYPPSNYVRYADEYYNRIWSFTSLSKGQQREVLGKYVSTPNTREGNGKFVVRPYRHWGGKNFLVVEESEIDNALTKLGGGYVSPQIDFRKEFRVLFYNGEFLSLLLKKVPDNHAGPVNHENGATFLTVNRRVYEEGPKQGLPRNDNLLTTRFYEDITKFLEDYPMQLVGIDVAYIAEGEYAVFEVNVCPGIGIDGTLESLANLITKQGA